MVQPQEAHSAEVSSEVAAGRSEVAAAAAHLAAAVPVDISKSKILTNNSFINIKLSEL